MEIRVDAANKAVSLIETMLKDGGDKIPTGHTKQYIELTRGVFPESGQRLHELWQEYLSERRREDARLRQPGQSVEVDMSRLFNDPEYNPYPKPIDGGNSPAAAKKATARDEAKGAESNSPVKEAKSISEATTPDELLSFFGSQVKLRQYMSQTIGQEIDSKINLLRLYKIFKENLEKFKALEAVEG